MSRSLFRGLFWIAVSLALLFHVAGAWHFSGVLIEDAFAPDPAPIVVPQGEYELSEVTYSSPLGEMDAWHLPAAGSTWVIHVHGKGASPIEAEHLFAPLQEAGYPQLAITYRNDEGQPIDPSGYYRYGVTEWEDIAGAMEFASTHGAEAVVFSGFSTGASHVLSYLYRHNLDDVRGVIMDSPNVDMGDTVDFGAGMTELPLVPVEVPVTLTWASKFVTSLRIGVNWKALDYVDRAESALRVPVLAQHGSGDLTVPVRQSQELADASPELVRLRIIDGAGHVDSYESDPDAYLSEVLSFLDQVG